MQWAEIDGKQRLLVGGKVNRFIPNPTFDPISKPGALDEYFRGRNPKGEGVRELFGDLDPLTDHPEYLDRDARLKLMDEQGMRGAIFLPTLGVGMEQALLDDPPALLAAFRAFNRWLEEDWGFAYQERIFGAPMLTLVDPDEALKSVQWGLDHDARFFVLVPGPVITRLGPGVARRPGVRPDVGPAQRSRARCVTAHGGNAYYTRLPRRLGRGHRDGGVPPEPVPFDRVVERGAGLVRQPARPRSVPALPQPAHGVDRDRLRLGVPPLRQADEVVLADAAGLPRRPARDVPTPRLGVAVLRGRPRRRCATSSVPTTC